MFTGGENAFPFNTIANPLARPCSTDGQQAGGEASAG